MHADQRQRIAGSIQQGKPVRPAAIPAVIDSASRVKILENDVITAAVAVIDQRLVNSGIKRCFDLIRQQPAHPVTMLDIFYFGVKVFKETEPGNTFNIGLNVNFHGTFSL